MDEIAKGQKDLEKRREQHQEDTADQVMQPIPQIVEKFFQGLPQTPCVTRSKDSSEIEAPPPVLCQYCGEEREPLRFPSGGYAPEPYPCLCDDAVDERSARAAQQAKEEQRHKSLALLNIGGLMKGKRGRMTFGKWDVKRNPPSSESGYVAIQQYCKEVLQGGRNWLFIHGPYGTGKTHLSIAALRLLALSYEWQPGVVVWPEHCSAVQESWKESNGPTEGQLWNLMRHRRLLLIDDLDKRWPTAWAMGKLYEVIEHRYSDEKPTIITANRSLSELTEFWETIKFGRGREWESQQVRDAGAAVLSRISGQLWGVVEMKGKDQRWA